MDQLREGIGLRAYGQKNPLIEYKQEGFTMFEEMMIDTNKETLKRIFRTDLSTIGQRSMDVKQRTKNLKTKSNVNILPKIAQQASQQISPTQTANSNLQRSQKIPSQPITVDKKVGRNEPCPCGSGKKYKKCHG